MGHKVSGKQIAGEDIQIQIQKYCSSCQHLSAYCQLQTISTMVSLLSWLFSRKGSQRQRPERVLTDKVLKLPTLENSLMMRSMCMNWTFRFEDALDVGMLQISLEDLISKGPNWKKLGGRFRINASIIPNFLPKPTVEMLKEA